MNRKANGRLLTHLQLQKGLKIGAPQVAGGIRLVPILRDHPRLDLRLSQQRYDQSLTVVDLGGKPNHTVRPHYTAYVPHGMIVRWRSDGEPVAAYGAELGKSRKASQKLANGSIQFLHRIAKREDSQHLRMLPLHMAMEGFLSLYFCGPDIVWPEYSQTAYKYGLSPRVEHSVSGHAILGLSEALRVFEIHTNQVGVLVFVADSLASAFILPNPDDYRALHRSLINDFYSDLIFHYALDASEQKITASIEADPVHTLDDLEKALDHLRHAWSAMHTDMAEDLIGRDVTARPIYKKGPFQLQQFMTDLSARENNYIGEAIVSEEGGIEYLKTYRLSRQQRSRALLLQYLSQHDWHLEQAATEYNETKPQFVYRMERYGFGYLLRDHVLHEMRMKR